MIKNTVIIPAYNEEEAIESVIKEVLSKVNEETEVMVVDDGSKDKTAELTRKFNKVTLVQLSPNRGKGNAMKAGVSAAQGENVFFIDADNTYPAENINKMIALLKENDAVYTKREYKNIPLFNQLGNKIFTYAIRIFWGFSGHDALTGLYGIKKKYFEIMNIESSRFSIETEICIKAAILKLKIAEINIDYRERLGESKLHGQNASWDILKMIIFYLFKFNPMLSLILPGLLLVLVVYKWGYLISMNYNYALVFFAGALFSYGYNNQLIISKMRHDFNKKFEK